jgi:sRNA-binding protein
MQKKAWLGHRIDAARRDMKAWPDWMIDSAKFEGAKRARNEQGKRVASTKKESQAKRYG